MAVVSSRIAVGPIAQSLSPVGKPIGEGGKALKERFRALLTKRPGGWKRRRCNGHESSRRTKDARTRSENPEVVVIIKSVEKAASSLAKPSGRAAWCAETSRAPRIVSFGDRHHYFLIVVFWWYFNCSAAYAKKYQYC
jgi:hypothetical protein